MKKTLLIFSVALVLFTAAFALGAAKQTLHIYTAFDADQAEVYIKAFEQSHPDIEVKWVRLSSGQVLARIRAEAANPQASLWFGGSNTSHIAAAKDGLLAPYKESLAWQFMPKQFKDPDGFWVGLYVGYIGFVSNTEFLKKVGAEAPTSWQDLLKPEFKGEISLAYPFSSGTAYTTLCGMLTAIGSPEPGFDPQDDAYIKAFDAQVHHYNESGSACITQAGQGEVGIGIAFSHDILKKGIAKGFPVVMTFPKEGTSYEIGGMALIKGGPEPELAKIFYNWALSKEAQDLYKQFYRIPLNPEATVAEGCVTASDVKVLPIDLLWYGEHKDEIIDHWHEVTGK
ncbi:ABC transporter substrate-binding protein [Candidatus Acetothermia bacterium]|nr:MAG: ABC transporter substrate-binding protein [Candidatus Acetothermia bacterium]